MHRNSSSLILKSERSTPPSTDRKLNFAKENANVSLIKREVEHKFSLESR